jgi:pre-mRNA branch site protein p14
VVFDDVMDAKNALEHLSGFHLQERYIVGQYYFTAGKETVSTDRVCTVLYHMPTKQEAAAKADLERREKELEEIKKRHNISEDA